MKHHAEDKTASQKHSQGSTPSSEVLVGRSKASEIKAALTAARDLAALQDVRREHPTLLRAGLAQRSSILQANQRAAERLLASFVEKSGFDSDKFEGIQAQNRAELRRIVEARRVEALKYSAQAKATFRAAVEGRRKAIERLAVSTGTLNITQVVLDTPFLIWPTPQTPDLFFDDYHIEPWNSWAKFKIDSTGNGEAAVNFYFLWENSTDRYVVINVDSWLMLSGSCQVDIQGHWYESELSSIAVSAWLVLREWWNQPPTEPTWDADQRQEILSLDLEKPFLGNFISPWDERVFRTATLRYSGEMVPPGGAVVITVGPTIYWQNSSGGIEADFDSGDYEIMCPFVQIQIVS